MQLVPCMDLGSTTAPDDADAQVRLERVFRREERPPTLAASSSLARISALAESERVDEAIDAAIRLVDDLFCRRCFTEVEDILRELDVDGLHHDVSVALLMATFPARDMLRWRGKAIARLTPVLERQEPHEYVKILQHLG